MQASTDSLEFAPPPEPGFARSLTLAVLAHLVLLAALTWGVRWKRDAENLTAEAELWSAVPQQAAPKPVEAPPPPPPPPPAPRVQAPPPPPAVRDADIAVEREKKRRELEKERQRQEQLELQKKAEADKKKKELEARRQQQDKERLAKEKEREREKEKEKLEAERERKEAEAKKRQQAQEAQRIEAQRQENIRRMQGLAGATGGETATGNAQRSSGPSASYAGRIIARVKPNIGFMDEVAGNPIAEVEVRAAPDGTITSRKLVKSSGVKSWDDAVLKAIDRTETLPRDTDGTVPSPLLLRFRPKD